MICCFSLNCFMCFNMQNCCLHLKFGLAYHPNINQLLHISHELALVWIKGIWNISASVGSSCYEWESQCDYKIDVSTLYSTWEKISKYFWSVSLSNVVLRLWWYSVMRPKFPKWLFTCKFGNCKRNKILFRSLQCMFEFVVLYWKTSLCRHKLVFIHCMNCFFCFLAVVITVMCTG